MLLISDLEFKFLLTINVICVLQQTKSVTFVTADSTTLTVVQNSHCSTASPMAELTTPSYFSLYCAQMVYIPKYISRGPTAHFHLEACILTG